MLYIKAFIFLFATIDPIGTIPVYLEATKYFPPEIKKKVAVNAVLVAAIVLLFFIVIGQIVIEHLQISLAAFQVSSSMVLFLFALSMIFGTSKPDEEKSMIKDYRHVTIFPIAVPSIASPGAIMAVVLLTDNHVYGFAEQAMTTLVVGGVLVITLLCLFIANSFQDKIGSAGISVISKIMGLIISALAVEGILSGLQAYFNQYQR